MEEKIITDLINEVKILKKEVEHLKNDNIRIKTEITALYGLIGDDYE